MDIQQQQQEEYLIKPNKYIILIDNRNDQRLIKITDHKNFRWRKIPIKLAALSKFQYYQLLEVSNEKLTPVEEDQESQNEEEVDEVADNENNRQIYTLQPAQKLQAEDIENIKNEGKNAEEIISTIAKNNEQFEKRTVYSKQKYIQKKKKKYFFRFHAEPTCVQNVHKYYFNSDPKVVGFMRWDMLAFILLQASPYKNVFLAQKTKGILLGSLLVRESQMIHVFSEEQKNFKRFPIVEELNISKERTFQRVKFFQWKAIQTLENTSYDNVILAGYYDFAGILKKIHQFLKNGCIICFYCSVVEPLHEAIEVMKENGYIHIKLFDSWCREQQVLKNRTHPKMIMDSHSGYLLTGIKV